MSRESVNDVHLYSNVFTILNESESIYNDETTNKLMNYYEGFIDQYISRSNDETEYLCSDEGYHKFRDNFLIAYRHYINMSNARFAIPLFIYLYDSNPIGFNTDKFDAFVEQAQGINFNELLNYYDVFQLGMNLNEVKGQARK